MFFLHRLSNLIEHFYAHYFCLPGCDYLVSGASLHLDTIFLSIVWNNLSCWNGCEYFL
jgi:hypothetical protein